MASFVVHGWQLPRTEFRRIVRTVGLDTTLQGRRLESLPDPTMDLRIPIEEVAAA